MTLRIHFAVSASIGLVAFPVGAAAAAPQFASTFSDHAVLQRDEPVHIWGTATPQDQVTVALSTGETFIARADADGHWHGDLPAIAAGGPFSLSAKDDEGTTTLQDIVMGDVYLCGGQSNMEFNLAYATNSWGMTQIKTDPELRYLQIARDSSPSALRELRHPATWTAVGPDTPDVSAVCYHMAKAIKKDQKVAIGLIDSYWGGTIIEAWISAGNLHKINGYAPGLDSLATYAKNPAEAEAGWTREMSNAWKASEPDVASKLSWIAPNFKDSDWKTITPDNGTWETSGDPALTNFDGIVWYRQVITLSGAQATQAATLNLGPIDDGDVTWVNGVEVGNTFGWDTPRSYVVPAGTLKAGKNVVVVRVLDTGGGGGLYGKMDRKLAFADGTNLILPTQWKYRISGQPLPGAGITYAPWSSPNGLTVLYNAMIAPLTPYTLKGVAWYQGENNVSDAKAYATLLPTLMADWRGAFHKPNLPFLIVQLANFGPVAIQPEKSNWAQLRNSQRLAVDGDAHAGLAVTVDIGDRTDIHPTQKTVVGERLARAAQAVVYGEDVTAGGPEAVSVKRYGDDIIIHFKDSNGGLKTYSSNYAIAFETCTGPNVCQYAIGTVQGDDVTLARANRPDITHVRYAWADSPYVNLYSADDLPAVPFEMVLTP